MKMILTLTKNEYIKLFRKKSVPILLLILMLLVFGISLIKPSQSYSYAEGYYGSVAAKNAEGFRQRKLQYQQELDSSAYTAYSGGNEAVSAVIKEFYEKQIELCDKASGLSISDPNDWRYSAINDLLTMDYMSYLYDYSTGSGEYAAQVKDYLNGIGYRNYNDTNRIFSYSANLEAIETNNYSESKRDYYESAKKSLDSYKVQLEEAKSKKAAGTGGNDIDFEIYKLNGIAKCSDSIVRTYKCVLDNKYEYMSVQDRTTNWTVDSFDMAKRVYESFLSEDKFKNGSNSDTSGSVNSGAKDYTYKNNAYVNISSDEQITYEEYSKQYKEKIAEDENKGLIGLYSLENGVTELTAARSSRYKSLSYVNLFWMIAPIAIFFASGIVSKEFSSKTINLLLIRPVKRWKILLSKYICIITLTFGTIVVCGAVFLLGTGLRYGLGDLSQPYIYITSGTAHSVSFILWFLWKMFLASLPVFCLVSLTFMFSSVTKGTSVSLILGVLTLFSSILILFFGELIKNPDVLTYMPFPYFSMWSYVFNDMFVLTDTNINIFSDAIKANLTYGTVLLIGLIVFSVVTVFADFTKKDIK